MSLEGFKVAEKRQQQRIFASVEGRGKNGKSHFAMTAPGPIAYIELDDGTAGVMDEFLDKGVQMQHAIFRFDPRKDDKEYYMQMWSSLKKAYLGALQSQEVRSVVIDTATSAWELCRLAHFGRLTKIMPHMYSEANFDFETWVKQGITSNKNVILLHRVKKEYKDDQPTGDYERAGYGNMEYIPECLIQVFRKDKWGYNDASKYVNEGYKFGFRIIDCRFNNAMAGFEFHPSDPEEVNVATLGQCLFPNSGPEDWV